MRVADRKTKDQMQYINCLHSTYEYVRTYVVFMHVQTRTLDPNIANGRLVFALIVCFANVLSSGFKAAFVPT